MSYPNNPRKIQGGTPLKMHAAITPATVTETIADALRHTWGQVRGAPKQLARVIDANVRTAENLLEGAHAPSSATLLKLMAEDDEVFERVLELTGRKRPADHEQIQVIKAALARLEGKHAA